MKTVALLWTLLLLAGPAAAQTNENAQYFERLVRDGYVERGGWQCGYQVNIWQSPGIHRFHTEIERVVKAEGYRDELLDCWVGTNPKAAFLIGVGGWAAVADATDAIAVSALAATGVPFVRQPNHYYVSPTDVVKVSTAIAREKMKLNAGRP